MLYYLGKQQVVEQGRIHCYTSRHNNSPLRTVHGCDAWCERDEGLYDGRWNIEAAFGPPASYNL